MGAACGCTDADTEPDNNTNRDTEAKEPLLAPTSDYDISIDDIDEDHVVQYICSLRGFDLLTAWQSVDINGVEELNTKKDLSLVFLYFVNSFVKSVTTRDREHRLSKAYAKKAYGISVSLARTFVVIMENYGIDDTEYISKDFYDEYFQVYLENPNPNDGDESEETIDDFNLLSAIMTSPIVIGDDHFDLDHTLPLLRAAIEGSKKERGENVALIMCALNEEQRDEVFINYTGSNGEKLLEQMENTFTGEQLKILIELARPTAYNDADTVEKARAKLKVDTAILNEILMTRTNYQLDTIKQAYHDMYGRTLMESLCDAFNNKGSYVELLGYILADDDDEKRRDEFDPGLVDSGAVANDSKVLYHTLELSKKLSKKKVIEILCKRSWAHVSELCKQYGKRGNKSLRKMIESKFGKKSGGALLTIIDFSRNRHSYFAGLLQKSMKGAGTDDPLLIRTIVSRCCIDLGEISAEFSHKYGGGKTLLQWIKGDTYGKGVYRTILLTLCGIGDDALNDDTGVDYDNDDIADMETTATMTSFDNEEDDTKVIDTKQTMVVNATPVGDDEKVTEKQDKATVFEKRNFDVNETAKTLFELMGDSKKKKLAKAEIINILTSINNKQRQELKRDFLDIADVELHVIAQDTLRKGKTLLLVLNLLQKPSEFHVLWCKQAIKAKRMDLLMEIICSCTNMELLKMKDLYNESGSDLLKDIENKILGSKKTAKFMIETIFECQRPETSKPNKKLCNVHLRELNQLLKDKKDKKTKEFFSKLFVSNSYQQIRYEIDSFNKSAEITMSAQVNKIVKKGGLTGTIVGNIMAVSTNKHGYFAQKIKNSLKGLNKDENLLIRTLVGRSEKDLGNIVDLYSEATEYGDGKTLKQVLKDGSKGSFQKAILMICGMADFDDDYEPSVSGFESNVSSPRGSVSNELPPYPDAASKSASVPYSAPIIKRPKSDITIDDLGLDFGDDDDDEDVYDPYDINEKKFGNFVIDKIKAQTAQRLMQHLKVGDDDIIEKGQIMHVLLFACVLFVKYKEKTEKRTPIVWDKKKLKKSLQPAYNWICEEKLPHNSLTKSDYKLLGTWLKEYYKSKN